MHGDSDCTVIPNQSEIRHDALGAAGVPAALEIMPDAVHADPAFFDPVHRAKVESTKSAAAEPATCVT